MKALLLSAYKSLQIADLPQPSPGPREVLVEVAACGICGSDVHGYDGSSGRRIPPMVMGHEASGTVVALGAEVTGYAVGDRVTFDSTVSCGRCEFCRRGEVNLCDDRQVFGVSCGEYRRAGAFAEYVTVPEHILYRLPDGLSFPEAAMLEAVSVALHAVSLSAGETSGQAPRTALVLGAGVIGLLVLQAARAAGFSRVYLADVDPTRLQLGAELGAHETCNPAATDLAGEIARITGGHGVDVAFEVVGRSETVASAIDCVRKGGSIILVGNIASEVAIPLQKVVTRQIRLQGSCASAGEYPEAMARIADGAIRVKPLISAVDPLSKGPEWFGRLYAREPNLMKIVLDPRPSADPQSPASSAP